MRDEARRVLATPSDQASFRAYDLNMPQDPSREMIFAPEDLRQCFTDELPPREGPVCLGLDCGEATSATAAFAVWPSTGRCESWMAFGDVPSLRERGQRDGARYDLMEHRGELRTYPGRVTPVASFLADVAEDLRGCRVHKLAADGYKDSEVMDFLERAGLRWPFAFRRVGAGKDGGRDVRSLQRLVIGARLRMRESLSLASAIANSSLRRDGNGNPGLDKATSRGRIDVLSAAVIAAGLAEPHFDRPKRRRLRSTLVG
jgi:phage terminase large subunit-like protein